MEVKTRPGSEEGGMWGEAGRGWLGMEQSCGRAGTKLGLGPAACVGQPEPPWPDTSMAGAPQSWSCHPQGDQGTGMWLCLLGSALLVIGTDFLEHQLRPI